MEYDDWKDKDARVVGNGGKLDNRVEPVVEDYQKLAIPLCAAIKETGKREGQRVRVELDLPVEVVALAAWLHYRAESYEKDTEFPLVDIGFPPVEEQRERAEKHLQASLCLGFWEDFQLLQNSIHPLLFEKPTEP
ncbi:MAG: hypothetical protein NPIRA05_11920 [Nitrospirales bacterium]|nr:MAG: hypothetical protein NPIRA05_11920 [Nitrospirales bacterium]